MAQKFTARQDSSLLSFLYEAFQGQSRTGVKAYLTSGRVLVNGGKVTAFDWPLAPGDVVEVVPKGEAIADTMRGDARKDLSRQGIEILYEDDYLLVVSKRAGLPTISPKEGAHVNNLYSILTDYVHTEKKADRKAAGMSRKGRGHQVAANPELAAVLYRKARVWIVHRLDRDTSGVLVFAKDERTKDLLQSKWNEMVLERKYVGVIEGTPEQERGRIESWLSENDKSLKVTSSPVDDGGQRAVTHYRLQSSNRKYSFVEFELETGRKNQIRVHASQVLGHPIVGDEKYGARSTFSVKAPNGLSCRRIALHAQTLVFRHPFGGQILRFNVPVPQEFGRFE